VFEDGTMTLPLVYLFAQAPAAVWSDARMNGRQEDLQPASARFGSRQEVACVPPVRRGGGSGYLTAFCTAV
jgi:hypothetical protein